MLSSGMWRCVALVRTDVAEKQVTANVPSSPIIFAQIMEGIHSSETSVLTTTTRRHIP
jgi:hypothetical protein